MVEEYIYERERDMLDYFRNNLIDPVTRGTDSTYVEVGAYDQKVFTLPNTLVKNVSDTITIAGPIILRKGYDYTVQYGEGSNSTTVTLNNVPNSQVIIPYHYGPSMIEREFSRTDAQLPRIIIIFLTGSEEPANIGDTGESGGKSSWFNASYRIEIRSKYATQARELASKAFNLMQKMRQAVLFRTFFTNATDMQNFDYDPEKDCYIWQFTANITWEIHWE